MYLTNIVFPLFPTVMPEFLKPDSTATECCKKINSLNSDNLINQINCLDLQNAEICNPKPINKYNFW